MSISATVKKLARKHRRGQVSNREGSRIIKRLMRNMKPRTKERDA